MLNEVEQGVRSLMGFSTVSPDLSSQSQEEEITSPEHLLKHWENRLHVTLVVYCSKTMFSDITNRFLAKLIHNYPFLYMKIL